MLSKGRYVSAEVEWVAGVIRVFSDGQAYGDPYEWAATVRAVNKTTVELLGVTVAPNMNQVRAMSKALVSLGFEYVVWDRIKDGKVKQVKLKIRA